jgi:hypothetical protein
MAEVVLETGEQWGEVGAGTEAEVLRAHRAVS